MDERGQSLPLRAAGHNYCLSIVVYMNVYNYVLKRASLTTFKSAYLMSDSMTVECNVILKLWNSHKHPNVNERRKQNLMLRR